MKDPKKYIYGLHELDKTQLALVGGKAANLGELTRVAGILVPDGFCVAANAFQQIIEREERLRPLLDQLDGLHAGNRAIAEICTGIRAIIEAIPIPRNLADEIAAHLAGFGEGTAFAVRSSATAEDLPALSAAGQQDSYLNIVGKEAILRLISRCWASLYTERAVSYRMQSGIGHCSVLLAVVVQKMVDAHAAGVLFTADPVTSNRKVLSIDAVRGLGDALVSGLVNPDTYKVTNGQIVDRKIGAGPEPQSIRTLKDDQILELERLGRKIESHFGYPQDVEWCLADGQFYIVQSRPITTLFPIPEAHDTENHVYVSVGHQQMMTDAMKPLGLSLFQLMTNAPMRKAGGRLFVDVTPMLATAAGRDTLLNVLGKSDPLIKGALTSIVERAGFIELLPEADWKPEGPPPQAANRTDAAPPSKYQTLEAYNPSIVSELIESSEAAIDSLERNIRPKAGTALVEFIIEDVKRLKKSLGDPRSFGVIMTGMNAAAWVNEKMAEWLDETSVADTLAQSVPNNITAEMGLALLDVADVIRPYPTVVEYLKYATDDGFWDGFERLVGGAEAQKAIRSYLDKYGARCAGEIDITRPRWSEKPSSLVPVLLSNIRNFEAGESKRRFERGLEEARRKESDLLRRLTRLPDGAQKAAEAKQMINLIRHYAGYREYPKYYIVRCFSIYKRALLREAERLARANIIPNKEDIYYLTLEEFREIVMEQKADQKLIAKRKEEFRSFEKLTPPRVITSDGEIVRGDYNRGDIPTGAIVGLAVSSGTVEGRARVILRMEDADPEEGDILVTRFTDPSWTPLFVSLKGLVTEVGGLMTHGAVIAREYGLPAVVGVENATTLIKDGQRIRVHGTEGYVEILDCLGNSGVLILE